MVRPPKKYQQLSKDDYAGEPFFFKVLFDLNSLKIFFSEEGMIFFISCRPPKEIETGVLGRGK